MTLQMLVQLNILLAAAPALAGWVLVMPLTHPSAARVACVAYQTTRVETASLSTFQRHAPPTPAHPAVLHRAFAAAVPVGQNGPPSAFAPFAAPFVSRVHPFPHAVRAP